MFYKVDRWTKNCIHFVGQRFRHKFISILSLIPIIRDDIPRFLASKLINLIFILESLKNTRSFVTLWKALLTTHTQHWKNRTSYIVWYVIFYILNHTTKINVLRSSLNFEEMLQNFLYLYKKKTQVVFFIFHFEQLSFFPLWMPWSMLT